MKTSNSAREAITTYERSRELETALLEADFCLPAGSIELARQHRAAQLTSQRLKLTEMQPWRRRYSDSHFEMRLGNYRGLTIICAQHERVREELTALLPGDEGNWAGDYNKLKKVNDFLSPFALQSSGTALFFTPGRSLFNTQHLEPPAGYSFRWLTPSEIANYRGSNPFPNALGFSKDRPDAQVIAAEYENQIIGVAGASEDSSIARQIGVDVLFDHQQRGLATALVQKLALAVLDEGFLPFYGTSPSHVPSQNVALRAGLEPCWFEYVSTSLLDVNVNQA